MRSPARGTRFGEQHTCDAGRHAYEARCLVSQPFQHIPARHLRTVQIVAHTQVSSPTPAPAPASFSGEVVRLSSLQLDESKEWLVKSLWDPGEPVVRVSNGSFVSRPGYHDVGMYIITRGHGQ